MYDSRNVGSVALTAGEQRDFFGWGCNEEAAKPKLPRSDNLVRAPGTARRQSALRESWFAGALPTHCTILGRVRQALAFRLVARRSVEPRSAPRSAPPSPHPRPPRRCTSRGEIHLLPGSIAIRRPDAWPVRFLPGAEGWRGPARPMGSAPVRQELTARGISDRIRHAIQSARCFPTATTPQRRDSPRSPTPGSPLALRSASWTR